MHSPKLGSSLRRRTSPQCPSLFSLWAVLFILLQLKTEYALAFGLLQQQPTWRSNHHQSLLLTRLFARSYSRDDNQRRTRTVNHHQRTSGSPNAVNTK
eukprot:scaffold7929_cov81-Cylindrotheca_fusiformis.AAC.1